MNTDVHSNLDYGKNLLAYLEANGVTAVIAGGFVRDCYDNVQFRDIDLYIRDGDWEVARVLISNGAFTEPEYFDESSPEYTHMHIQFREELKHDEPGGVTLDVDLIGINSRVWDGPLGIIEKFNLGFNQIALESDGHIVTTPHRLRDRANQTCTILRTDWGIAGTAKAVDKLLVKYPHLQVVDPTGQRLDLDVFRTEGFPAKEVEWANT